MTTLRAVLESMRGGIHEVIASHYRSEHTRSDNTDRGHSRVG